ncbi:hypothetical protein CN918_27000 [Priestia megaterium]|nr:hypothetical protein CN918_27000 [Priestia megaterium]
MKHQYISYSTATFNQKPNTIDNPTDTCPFCNKKRLMETNEIVHHDETKVLMKNKYPVLKNAEALVLVEQPTCEHDLTNYPLPVLIDVLRYGMTKWLDMMNSGKYKSVLFFKNHGPLSGGSIYHPHMQLIGLYDQFPEQNLSFDDPQSISIHKEEGISWSLSSQPFSERYEFTIRMSNMKNLSKFAQAIQHTAHFIIHHLNTSYKSFNLCFYHVHNEIIVKVLERKPTSALLLGYGLSQVPSNLNEVAMQIQSLYKI